ncbi:MAG: UDP-3-O-acyl-N-acetylglucosamine deacetylase [Candidatus Sericytochromatia bacterium]|nr:UDP-3-O-acyl-N-acetylglucosamine deacetylase [Candidatus Sericytochromatia bacterium]
MLSLQHNWTLAEHLKFTGTGLHTGKESSVSLLPSTDPGYWLWQDGRWLQISPEQVSNTRLCTQIGTVMTLEHLLATLYGLGLSAVKIRVDGPECPILDGSAREWVQMLEPLRVALPSQRRIWRLARPWHREQNGVSMRATPADTLSLVYAVDYDKPEMHLQQQYAWDWSSRTFGAELAPARTFGFASDLAAMQSSGRALGGTLENALLISSPDSLQQARFADEPVRHKMLDLLGDLSLLGRLLLARLEIRCGGHQSHVIMAKTLLQEGWLHDEPCPPID